MGQETSVFRLDEEAVEVPRCGRDLLVRDDRAFDAEMVRGAVVFYNLTHAGPREVMEGIATRAMVDQAFAWVPEVIAERARRAQVDVANVKWRAPTDRELFNSKLAVFTLLGPLRGLAQQFRFELGSRRLSSSEWLDEVLSSLPIYSRFRFEDERITEASVPLLRGLSECVAYAIAVVRLDRRKPKISERIRECPYTDPHFGEYQSNHYFLDFRVGEDGRLETNRLRFCCPAHNNRYKSRMHRKKVAKGRRHK